MTLHAITRARRQALVTVRLDALAQALRTLPADQEASRRLVQRYGRAIGSKIGPTAADLICDALRDDPAIALDLLDTIIFAAVTGNRAIAFARGRHEH